MGRRCAAAAIAPYADLDAPWTLSAEQYATFGDPSTCGAGVYAIAPFSVDGRWGVIAVAAPETVALGGRELELLGGLAHQSTLAIANASSFESLERTFLSTIEALANALEARDATALPCAGALTLTSAPGCRRRDRCRWRVRRR